MIEHYQSFHYRGYVTHQDRVLYVFDEGIYAQVLPQATEPPALHAPAATDDAYRNAVRQQLLQWPCPAWLRGWFSAGETPTWGNAAAEVALAQCDLSAYPTIGWVASTIFWEVDPRTPFSPVRDDVFVWCIEGAPTRYVILPRPMMTPGCPGFNPVFSEAAAKQVLSHGELGPKSPPPSEIPGIDQMELQGYQIQTPGQPPNLVFRNGGVLIQDNGTKAAVGFHPKVLTDTALVDNEALELFIQVMREPNLGERITGNFVTHLDPDRLGEVPARQCVVMIDRLNDGTRFAVTPLPGYVPLRLNDGSPNPATDPTINTASARALLAQSRYADGMDPRRVSDPRYCDHGSNWDVDEISAVVKALYCNHPFDGRFAQNQPGHSYLFPFIKTFYETKELNLGRFFKGYTPQEIERELLILESDRDLKEWLKLRLKADDVLKLLKFYGLTVVKTSHIASHPEPFKDGEFKNAIVMVQNPPLRAHPGFAMDRLLNSGKLPRLPTNSFQKDDVFNNDHPAIGTTLYYAPNGQLLIPGNRAYPKRSLVPDRFDPTTCSGWGAVTVIQL